MTQYDVVVHWVRCDQCGAEWIRGQLPNGKRPVRVRYNNLHPTWKVEKDFCNKACLAAFEAEHPDVVKG
jgi:hypothetical protein